MRTWIKLHIEILEDPKMGRLPDRLFRRAIELFLMAGKNDNNGGVLPPVEDIAWLLRVGESDLLDDLQKLQEVNIVHETEPGVWVVTHFAERQDADTTAERVAKHRNSVAKHHKTSNDNETKRYGSCNDDVTKRYNSCNEVETKSYVEEDKDKEVEEESESEAEAEIAAGAGATNNRHVSEQITTQKTAVQDTESEKQTQIGAVFREYESNIGPLTPIIAEKIGDLVDHYPRDWISAAIREAVAHEARNLKYIEAILKRWKSEGFKSFRQNGKSARGNPKSEDSMDDMLRDYVQKYPPPKAS
ncbi:MAG: DnaD domain protein [Anaerolineales bacterium]|jgi:DnaD/phage-associated family protein